MIPAWLQHHLEATGRWNADGISTHVRSRRCRRCAAVTLVALDAPVCGGVATVDHTPLTSLGEAIAHIGGRPTWKLIRAGRELELTPREQITITRSPADQLDAADILPLHTCGQPISGELVRPSRIPVPARHRYPLGADPPF